MKNLSTLSQLGLFLYFSLLLGAHGQVSSSPSLEAQTNSPPAVLSFQQPSQNLGQQLLSLNAQGATFQQLQAWFQQNVVPFQQQALALALAAPASQLPYITEVEVPDGATQEMVSFLSTHADLLNGFAQLYNQQAQNGTETSAFNHALNLFQQQNGPEIQMHQQLAQVIAAQSARQLMPIPAPLIIPSGSSPQMKVFLILRDRLLRSQITMQNDNAASTIAARANAMQRWAQQNAADLQMFQQLSQSVANQPTR